MDKALIDMRLLFAYAYGCLAIGIIVAHNHPSGLKPSKDDHKLTQKLKHFTASD